MAAKQKPGRTDTKTASENRKIRNRLSQKAFRARQTSYVKELEKRLEGSSKSESERCAELEQRNEVYRVRLLGFHKKLESLQVTLKASSDSVAVALEFNDCLSQHKQVNGSSVAADTSSEPSPPETPERFKDGKVQVSYYHESQCQEDEAMEIPSAYDADCNDTHDLHAVPDLGPKALDLDNLFGISFAQAVEFSATHETHAKENKNLQIPPTMPYIGMGPPAYENLLCRGPLLLGGPGFQLHGTNSPFSDHLTAVEHFLKRKWTARALYLASSVSFMFSSFVALSWPATTAFYTLTRCHLGVNDLTTFHLNPTPQTYSKLLTCYHPTQTQLTAPYPAVLALVPFPGLRDKLMIYHSGNPRLDELICDIGSCYVVEAPDVSKIVADLDPVRGYITVWDLVCTIAPDATVSSSSSISVEPPASTLTLTHDEDLDLTLDNIRSTNDHVTPQLPAPSTAALFRSKTLALQAFKLLNMDRGVSVFKLDPTVFEKYPELYDPSEDIMARGLHLKPPGARRAGIPTPLPTDPNVLGRYRELTTWTFDLSSEGIYHARTEEV